MHEYRSCCFENAAQSAYRLCPECGTRFIRCPSCQGLLSSLGYCGNCLKPVVEIKSGMRLKEGALCNVPLKIGNLGTQPFTLRALSYSVPGHARAKALRANLRLAPGSIHEYLDVAISLDRSGEYALNIECELDWQFGKRIGMAFAASAVASAGSRDALINTEGGTGNMIYISGEASSRIVEQQLERDSSSVEFKLLPARLLQASEMPAFGEADGTVTLATQLEVPDLYSLCKGAAGEPLEVWPDPRTGVLLGRDRPGSGGKNHASLRVPRRVANAAQLTKQLSGTHWQIYPSEGRWWLQMLGRLPTLVGPKLVERGQTVALAEDVILCPFSDRPSALRIQLRHIERQDGLVRKSSLILR